MRRITALLLLVASSYCNAGIGSWLKNEVAPTLTGKRPLKIDPNRVSIVHKGKPILKYEGDSLYIKGGGVTLQTSKLRQRIAEAGAIFSGDMAVLSKVGNEQLGKELEKAAQRGELTLVNEPSTPSEIQEEKKEEKAEITSSATAIEKCAGRTVTLHNLTPVSLRYALNGGAFEISSGNGYRHCSENGDFFLQFDEDITDGFKIARYSLTGNVYRLFLANESSSIQIAKIN